MWGLLYKDLILHKRIFLIFAGILLGIGIWNVIAARHADFELELGFLNLLHCIVIFLFLEFMENECIFGGDEFRKWQSFISSTEGGNKLQVASKYLMNFLLTTTSFQVLQLYAGISSAVTGLDNSLFALGYQLLWVQLLIRSVESPLIIAFGTKIGNLVRQLIIITLVFGAIMYGLFGDLSVFGSPVEFVLWVKKILAENGPIFLLIIPPVTLALYLISYKISCVLYLKGGEHYDR